MGWRALKPLEVGCIIRTGTALSYHLTSSVIYFFFPITPIKLWARLLRATHLDQSNYLANQQQVSGFVLHFYQPLHLAEKCGAKTIVQSQTGMFWLCSSNFLLHGNVSSTLKLFLTFRFFFICVLLLYSCSSASSPYEGFLLRSFFSFSFFFLLFCFLPLLFDFSFSFSLKCNEVAELIIGKENTLPIVDHNNTIIH